MQDFIPKLIMAKNLIVRLDVAVTVQRILDFDLFCAPQRAPLGLYHLSSDLRVGRPTHEEEF